MDYSQTYFLVASGATILVAFTILVALFYILSILSDIKKVSRLAKKEAHLISRGLQKIGSFSEETGGFLANLFAIILAQFVEPKGRSKKSKEV